MRGHVSERSLLLNSANELEAAKLMRFKTAASRLEQETTYFYVQITPSQTTVSPYLMGKNGTKLYDVPDPVNVNPYFTPIGTTRTINLLGHLQNISGLNLEDNRYKFEINLETIVIEQDAKNWQNLRHFGTAPTGAPNTFSLERTYDVVNRYAEDATIPAGAEQNVTDIFFKEALKETTPEPLFVRIDELCDSNKAFNFIGQPSGEVVTLTGQQPFIVDNLMKVPTMTIRFGHLIFKGTDEDYLRAVDTFDTRGFAKSQISTLQNNNVPQSIDRYDNFEYLDYNEEHYNTQAIPADVILNTDNQYVAPAARAEFIQQSKSELGAPGAGTVNLRTRPLFSNQQVGNILMKFSVKFIALF